MLSRRSFLGAALLGGVRVSTRRGFAADEPRETLYNGIALPTPWPPVRPLPLEESEPERPPYEIHPPDPIPIDLGRQLFVDDFLIAQRTLDRTFHRARYDPRNPVLRPEAEWEIRDERAIRTNAPGNPTAMVFSDGVFWDPSDRLFRMWYMGGYDANTCLAVSHDGLVWERPAFDVVAGTNIVSQTLRDSNTVWLDLDERDASRRYKMVSSDVAERRLHVHVSPDGIHWTDVGRSTPLDGDRTTVFYNPFRKRWVFSIRDQAARGVHGRFRRYADGTDLVAAGQWPPDGPVFWVSTDRLDRPRADLGTRPELYNLDAVAYESVLLGLFTIFRGERNDREKPNDLCVGFSRDGFHWSRPSRRPFIPVSEHVGDWNWSNVQSAGGCCLVVGDALWFYVSGRQGRPGTSDPGVCSTGLATLRRDGFASLHPRTGHAIGTVTTRPVRFAGRHLRVNADVAEGALRAAVLDRQGRVIPPFSVERCHPVRANGTNLAVEWRRAPDLSALAGEPVRFRFEVSRGSLFSFWVSDTPAGRSGGFVAAGGPGFSGTRDM